MDAKRILVLAPTAGDADRFRDVTDKLALELLRGCADSTGTLRVNFETRDSALQIVDFVQQNPVAAIIPVGNAAAPLAARAATMMGLPSHAPKAADCCLNKEQLRIRLEAVGLAVLPGVSQSAGIQPDLSFAQSITLTCLMTNARLRVLAVHEDQHAAPRTLASFSSELQQHAANALKRLVGALSLKHGPVFVQLAYAGNDVKVADASVAYTPSTPMATLSFRIPLVDEDISWEELIIRNALGLDTARVYLDTTH